MPDQKKNWDPLNTTIAACILNVSTEADQSPSVMSTRTDGWAEQAQFLQPAAARAGLQQDAAGAGIHNLFGPTSSSVQHQLVTARFLPMNDTLE